jgi:hypothetical protein
MYPSAQYSHPKWRAKRIALINERGKKCERCDNINNLEIHHKRYAKGKKVWEYPNTDLLILCSYCHSKEHNRPTVQYCEYEFCETKPPTEIEKRFSLCYPCYRDLSGRLTKLEKETDRRINEARDHYRALRKNYKNLEKDKAAFKESLKERDELIENLTEQLVDKDLIIEDLRRCLTESIEAREAYDKNPHDREADVRKIKQELYDSEERFKKYKADSDKEINNLENKVKALSKSIELNKKETAQQKKELIKQLDAKDQIIRELLINKYRILKNNVLNNRLSIEELDQIKREKETLQNEVNKYKEDLFELMHVYALEIQRNEKFMRNLMLLLFIVVFGIIGYLAFNPESKVQPGGEEIILPGGDEDVEIELVPNDFRLGDIENFIDTYIVQKFIVADVYEDDKRVILNIGGSFPRQKLALVIWSDDFRKFSNLEPFKKLKGKQVICRGLIDDSYKGQPQVVIREAHQLELRD